MNLVVSACSSSSSRRKTKTIIPQVESIMTIKPKRLVEMLRELNRRGRVYSRTRGTHSAMICKENGDVLAFSEDVGRHNAIDKVVGALFLGNEYFGRCVLLSTGRQSSEMILKAAYAGIPLVASMTVPLISGVRMAEETGVTLTSISGGVLQIYSGVERIKKENSF
jgi:FdhD protein